MIESALADENCSIKSLDLTQVTADLACMLCIKNGLAQNTSIKCLREIIPPLTIAVPLLVPVQVNTMEKLDIRGCRIDGPVLAQVLQQMPMLKSLCLTGSRRRSDLSDVFATVFNGVILLQELNVAGVIRDNESLQELALHLATNTHLKVLDLRDVADALIQISGGTHSSPIFVLQDLRNSISLTPSRMTSQWQPYLAVCLYFKA
jgi:hypothetical protein